MPLDVEEALALPPHSIPYSSMNDFNSINIHNFNVAAYRLGPCGGVALIMYDALRARVRYELATLS